MSRSDRFAASSRSLLLVAGRERVRIEDLVLVTANGTERLTRFTKELLTVE